GAGGPRAGHGAGAAAPGARAGVERVVHRLLPHGPLARG
ncbi:MAG: Error-prone repair homolog of DNA polymerase III alpha subunit, partial [uncultured Solirubrobacteraceae bacterium]